MQGPQDGSPFRGSGPQRGRGLGRAERGPTCGSSSPATCIQGGVSMATLGVVGT